MLTLLVRRKRLVAERAADIGAALDSLRIVTVPPDMPSWRAATTSLAAAHHLTVYDASYLRLAVIAGAQLASCDHALQNASRMLGIEFTASAAAVGRDAENALDE